jgi:serine/threonine protein kinase
MAISDRYQIDENMGEGGFSRVYRGQERATGRHVALKVLKSAFYENAEVRERFQREVFAVASLSNPHIVGMYDFDLNSDDLYIAMEYVAGRTLRECVGDRYTLAERFSILAQIGDAIACAHDRNVVHRDLKPENVKIVEHDGQLVVKVLDFGMAKLTELESQLELRPLTKVGICFGTPQYMSPEQIRGKLDDRSIDLYALAIIAYEVLVGQRPWDGEDPYEVMRAVLQRPVPPFDYLADYEEHEQPAPERLEALNAFFQRALAKALPQRPESARQLIEELERALFGDVKAARTADAAASFEEPRTPRRDDTVPFSSLDAKDTASLPALVRERASADTDPTSVPRNAGDTLSNELPIAPRGDETGATTAPSRVALDPEYAAEQARLDSIVAANAAMAFARRKKGSWRGVVIALLILAALGGSVGYLLGGSASAQSNEILDFIVGKQR